MIQSSADITHLTTEELTKLAEHISDILRHLNALQQTHEQMFHAYSLDDPVDPIESMSPEVLEYYIELTHIVDMAYRRRTLINQGICTR